VVLHVQYPFRGNGVKMHLIRSFLDLLYRFRT
jgi:hypothetical protein